MQVCEWMNLRIEIVGVLSLGHLAVVLSATFGSVDEIFVTFDWAGGIAVMFDWVGGGQWKNCSILSMKNLSVYGTVS